MVIGPELLRHALSFDLWFTRGTFFLFAVVLIALCRPYKKMYMNVCDTLLLSHLAMICFLLSQRKIKYYVEVMQSLFLFPFAVFALVMFLKLLCKIHFSHLIKSLCQYSICVKTDLFLSQPKSIRSLNSYGAVS